MKYLLPIVIYAAFAAACFSATLSWGVVTNADSYRAYHWTAAGCSNWATATNRTTISLTSGSNIFRVIAVNSVGTSVWSNAAVTNVVTKRRGK